MLASNHNYPDLYLLGSCDYRLEPLHSTLTTIFVWALGHIIGPIFPFSSRLFQNVLYIHFLQKKVISCVFLLQIDYTGTEPTSPCNKCLSLEVTPCFCTINFTLEKSFEVCVRKAIL
jgi:hypothetical protein